MSKVRVKIHKLLVKKQEENRTTYDTSLIILLRELFRIGNDRVDKTEKDRHVQHSKCEMIRDLSDFPGNYTVLYRESLKLCP
jgi:hypothetical protein